MSDGGKKLIPLAEEQVRVHQLYTEYLYYLASLKQRIEKNEKTLEICLDATVATLRFIDANEIAFKDGLSKPLAILAQALRDVQRGAHPPLFDVGDRRKKKGAPEDLSNTRVAAVSAAVLELLRHRGISLNQAATFVAIELEKLEISSAGAGKDITPETVINWRKEMKRRKNSEAGKFFASLLAELTHEVPKDTSQQDLIKEMQDVISALADSGVGAKIVI